MYKLNLIVGLFSMTFVLAQEAQILQKEIDQTLWKPFQVAFEKNDGPALNSLYAEQVLRVTPNGIDTDNKFKHANLMRFDDNKAKGIGIQLDFWFDSRKTNATTSYEVGFYRMQLVTGDEVNSIYGQFHIVLEKKDGVWKITQDWDTTSINGQAITAADFERKQPLSFK